MFYYKRQKYIEAKYTAYVRAVKMGLKTDLPAY